MPIETVWLRSRFSRVVRVSYLLQLIVGTITSEKYPTVEDYLKRYVGKYEKYNDFYGSETKMIKYREEVRNSYRTDFPSHILTSGFYALHLSRWLDVYSKSTDLLVLNGEDLMNQPGRVIERVQTFLGLPKLLLESDYVRDSENGTYCLKHPITAKMNCIGKYKMRTRNGRTPVLEDTLTRLRKFYRPANELLYKMIGERFDW